MTQFGSSSVSLSVCACECRQRSVVYSNLLLDGWRFLFKDIICNISVYSRVLKWLLLLCILLIFFFSKVSAFCLVGITSQGTSANTCRSEEGSWKMWLNVTLIKLKYYINIHLLQTFLPESHQVDFYQQWWSHDVPLLQDAISLSFVYFNKWQKWHTVLVKHKMSWITILALFW